MADFGSSLFLGDITVTGSIKGNASSAAKLETARTLALSGDVTGSAAFDGTGNVTITATVADDSHNHIIANVDGLQTALDGKSATTHNHTLAGLSEKNYSSLAGRPADDDLHSLALGTVIDDTDEILIYDTSLAAYRKMTRAVFLEGIAPEGGAAVKYEEFTATAGQKVFNLTQGSYAIGGHQLAVSVWGINQPETAYTESSATSFTFASGLNAGDKVIARWYQYDPSIKGEMGDMPAHQWSGTQLRFESDYGLWGSYVELKGDQGDMPEHEWSGTQLRFESSPGVWGSYVDLKGEPGDNTVAHAAQHAIDGTDPIVDFRIVIPYAVATNSGNAYSISSPAITAYVTGMAVSVKIPADSTGTSTLNWSSLGAKTIKKPNGTDLTNLKAGGIYTLRYDGTNFIVQGEGGSGDALASELLSGKTATTDAGDITGTMPNNGGLSYSPSTSVQNIPAGYTSGGTISAVGGTAVAADVLATKTFSSAAGIDQTGSMVNYGGWSSGLLGSGNTGTNAHDFSSNASGYYGYVDLISSVTGYVNTSTTFSHVVYGANPDVVKVGQRIGNSSSTVYGTFTSDATATAGQMLSGATAYVNGDKVTGTMANQSGYTAAVSTGVSGTTLYVRIPQGGYLTNGGAGYPEITVADGDFTAANIKSGINIFGVTGTAPIPSGTAGTAQVLAGYTFSNGSSVGLSGAMTNRGAYNITPSNTGNVAIPSGYHNGSGVVYAFPGKRYASGSHAGASGATITATIGWQPKYVIIRGTHGIWLLTSTAFTYYTNNYDSNDNFTGTTTTNLYSTEMAAFTSSTMYGSATNGINATGFSFTTIPFDITYNYTWEAYGIT